MKGDDHLPGFHHQQQNDHWLMPCQWPSSHMTTSTTANVFLAFHFSTAINYSLENETGRQWPLNPKDKEIRPIYARFVRLLLMPINTACTLMERWEASLSSSSSPTFCWCCLCTHLFTNNLMRLFFFTPFSCSLSSTTFVYRVQSLQVQFKCDQQF